MAGIEPLGLAVHIGSQLLDLAPYRSAFAKIAGLVAEIRADGHRIESLDLGGGLGIAYHDERAPAIEDYVRSVQETVGNLGCQLFFEPGRWLVGHAGILVTRVLYVKPGVERNFVIVDAAMNDLIRPTLYDAYHPILPVAEPGSDAAASRYDVVGPICETGDFFAHGRPLPPLQAGDLLAIASAGLDMRCAWHRQGRGPGRARTTRNPRIGPGAACCAGYGLHDSPSAGSASGRPSGRP
jgi:diaminopimelate decarboxylase